MDIRIKSLHAVNFKGIRDLRLDFNGENRTLHGANATCKTSCFDAFTWTLFGKDSKGASAFEIKTLTPDGEVMWKLPHSVTVELLVDGKLTTLRREYEEEWVKQRGGTEEVFKGHKVNRFWNDVPCSAAEFDKKVAELCEESLFRLITNPAHFNSLDDKEKMRLLNTLEGNTTDEQFMAASEFADFLRVLDGKSLDEYKRELAAKMNKVNEDIKSSHTRLDEVKRGMPEEQDWAAIEAEIKECDTEITRLKGLQTDAAKQSEESGKARAKIQNDINTETEKLENRKRTMRSEARAEYNRLSDEKERLVERKRSLEKSLAESRRIFDESEKKNSDLSLKLSQLSEAYKRIHARVFEFDEASQVCPTCKQLLPAEDIENQRQILLENFNTDKARMLEENVKDGSRASEERESARRLIDHHDKEMARLNKEISEINANPLLSQTLEEPSDPDFTADPEIATIQSRIDELRKKLDENPVAVSITSTAFEMQVQEAKKQELQKRLYVRGTIAEKRNRISEIENSIKTNGQTLTELERDANTIKEIQKAKALSVEARINSMFSIVRFKMVADQINGGDRQVCETTVGGVPYSSLNNAHRIMAGMDIITAFSRHFAVTAPVFVDNSEALNEVPAMDCQVICLRVTDDKTLTLA